jgi:hypothetical protein
LKNTVASLLTVSFLLAAHAAFGQKYTFEARPASLTCDPTSLGPNDSSTCTVTLSLAARIDGSAVTLSSSNAALMVPASVTIAAGATSATFTVTSFTLSTSQSATVEATLNGVLQTATINLVAPIRSNALTCTPASLEPNAWTDCTFTLNQAAPTGGSFVTVSTTNPLLTVPASFTVNAGSTSASFAAISGDFSSSQSATIRATLEGISQSATISLVAGVLPTSLTCAPNSMGPNASTTCEVTLNRAASAGGATVALSNNNTLLTVPASVTVADWSTSATFKAATGALSGGQSASIAATLNGVSQIATIGLVPSVGKTDSLSLSSATAGPDGTVSLRLNLTSAAGNEETALQWKLVYPPGSVFSISAIAGPAAIAAGATLSCVAGLGAYTCLAFSMGRSVIPNGTVAIVNLTTASVLSATAIDVTSSLGSSGAGDVITVVPSGGIVN